MTRVPYRKNIPGDFYVEDGCCTACELPFSEAPGFFKFEVEKLETDPEYESSHCYFCKQPSSDVEVGLVLSAMEVQELDCIRYKGTDGEIIEEIKERKLNEYSDYLEDNTTPERPEKRTSFLNMLFSWLK